MTNPQECFETTYSIITMKQTLMVLLTDYNFCDYHNCHDKEHELLTQQEAMDNQGKKHHEIDGKQLTVT